eukprot:TRINITY_DN2618_c0_g1_i32.p1 TRINITY_DN2618_c0_g1~~TRINITY_DN2618_c0_g1_i32.p1  ORF type:complete len:259 (-),score=46.61 TRINITY_DN2618_c0_g1_i32:283-1059(-)
MKTRFVREKEVYAESCISLKWTEPKLQFDLKLSTKDHSRADFRIADVGIVGSKFHLSSSEPNTIDTSLNFSNNVVALHVGTSGNVIQKKIDSLHGSLVGRLTNFLYCGVWVKKKIGSIDSLVVASAALFALENFKACVKLLQQKGQTLFNLYWFQSLHHSLVYASTFQFVTPTSGGKGTSADLGAVWKIDELSSLKGKWTVTKKKNSDVEMRVNLSLQQRITSHIAASLMADLNASRLLGNVRAIGRDHAFGVEISVE